MKIYSWNVNGIRSSVDKGLWDWFNREKPDILCLQEIKAKPDQIPEKILGSGYFTYINSAEKPGYSGTAIFTKNKPQKSQTVIGFSKFDLEGRIIRLDFRDFILINLYLPHGGRGKEKLDYKLEVYENLFKYLSKLKNKKVILVGDFNIAHNEIDLARPKNNKNNIMFTQEERNKIDKLIDLGFLDSFREFNQEGENYSWWPYFADARKRNLGWRIDYVFISKNLKPKLKKVFILPEVRGSDHCPVGIEI